MATAQLGSMEAAAYLASVGWRNGFHLMEPWNSPNWTMPAGLHGYMTVQLNKEQEQREVQPNTLGALNNWYPDKAEFTMNTPAYAQGGSTNYDGDSGMYSSGVVVLELRKRLGEKRQAPVPLPSLNPLPLGSGASSQTMGTRNWDPFGGPDTLLHQVIRW